MISNPTGAGEFRDRVVIEERVSGSPQQLASGEPDETWSTVVTTWGKVMPIVGRELFAADQVQSKVDTRINIRWRTGIAARMRARHNGITYNIEAVLDVDNARTELLLLCSSGVHEG